MRLWHLTADTPRIPRSPNAGEQVRAQIGLSPIEDGQAVWVEVRIFSPAGEEQRGRVPARWKQNEGNNSYWEAIIGPFADADRVTYKVHGESPAERLNQTTGLWHSAAHVEKTQAGPL